MTNCLFIETQHTPNNGIKPHRTASHRKLSHKHLCTLNFLHFVLESSAELDVPLKSYIFSNAIAIATAVVIEVTLNLFLCCNLLPSCVTVKFSVGKMSSFSKIPKYVMKEYSRKHQNAKNSIKFRSFGVLFVIKSD